MYTSEVVIYIVLAVAATAGATAAVRIFVSAVGAAAAVRITETRKKPEATRVAPEQQKSFERYRTGF